MVTRPTVERSQILRHARRPPPASLVSREAAGRAPPRDRHPPRNPRAEYLAGGGLRPGLIPGPARYRPARARLRDLAGTPGRTGLCPDVLALAHPSARHAQPRQDRRHRPGRPRPRPIRAQDDHIKVAEKTSILTHRKPGKMCRPALHSARRRCRPALRRFTAVRSGGADPPPELTAC
jgi:hypothetical protein